jgi:hypothetical protein
MSPDFNTQIWNLPGAQHFLDDVSRKLKDGISLWLLLPEAVRPDQIVDRLEHHLGMLYYSNTGHIDLSVNNNKMAMEVLKQAFPYLNEYRFLDEFVNVSVLPDTLILYGMEHCSKEQINNWAQSFARWAEACRSTGARRSLALVTNARTITGINLPSPDIRLDYQYWMGIPSVLEFRILCRMMGAGNTTDGQWRETMIASLAGSDLSLGEELWEVIADSFDAVVNQLILFARRRGWHEMNFSKVWRNWRPSPPGAELDIFRLLKSRNFDLLSQGMTVYTPEYGEEIHSSILAVLHRLEEIKHRMWRAQAAILLPQIDDLRRRVCELITQRHGEHWTNVDGQMLCPPLEMSKLRQALALNFGNDSWEYRHLYPWVQDTCIIRNKLAHYEPISFAEYINQWRNSANMHQLLVPGNNIL